MGSSLHDHAGAGSGSGRVQLGDNATVRILSKRPFDGVSADLWRSNGRICVMVRFSDGGRDSEIIYVSPCTKRATVQVRWFDSNDASSVLKGITLVLHVTGSDGPGGHVRTDTTTWANGLSKQVFLYEVSAW